MLTFDLNFIVVVRLSCIKQSVRATWRVPPSAKPGTMRKISLDESMQFKRFFPGTPTGLMGG
jgi:hypothetical protein